VACNNKIHFVLFVNWKLREIIHQNLTYRHLLQTSHLASTATSAFTLTSKSVKLSNFQAVLLRACNALSWWFCLVTLNLSFLQFCPWRRGGNSSLCAFVSPSSGNTKARALPDGKE